MQSHIEHDRPIPYEAPRLTDLGSLDKVTQGPQRTSAGDGVSLNGPRIGSR